MKNNRIWPRRRTAMLLLAALFSVRCFSYPVSGDMKTARERTVFVEDDEGGSKEVWLENDLGFSDSAFRRRYGREGSRATESSLGKGGASPSSLAGQRATASVLRGQAASSSNLAMPAFLSGFLPASPSALLKSAGERKVNVHVTKTWGDGASAHAGEEVTVHLLADGADTGRTAVLNRDGGWEADFKGLPASGEHGVIDYRVSEDVPSGYVPFYSYSGGADGHEYWIPAETVEEGGTYVLAANGIAPTAEGGDGSMVMRALDRQTRARRIEGKVCHDYIADPGEDAMWVFSKGAKGWEMTSPESGRMLAFDRVNSTYAFTTRENPISARRAFFPENPEESTSGLTGEINGRAARTFALGSAGGAVSVGSGASFRVYRRSDAPWELEVSVDNRHSERPEPKVVIPHRKTIDAFRDGEENPDTDLDNGQEDLTDLYRLYLDAGTVNETLPLNVVLVLDYSGSMNPRADDPRRESYFMDGQTRYEVLRDTVCPADRDGIVDLILSDPDNRMSLVTFSWLYEENTAIAADWTDSAEEIRDVILSGNPAEGTNYDQALRMVSELLGRIPEGRKDYPTYVLFMSDGVPTEYVTQNGLPGGYVSPGVTEVSGPGGTYGSVGVETVQNLELVIPATLAAVNQFRERWPKVNISTVAFSNQDMGAVICVPEYIGGEETETCVEMEEGYTYDMVLRNMIQNRGAFYTAANGEELKESFEDMVLASRVTHAAISDELSEYAEIYGEQPDYRVTMKKEGEEEIVLWENGALTEAAAGKLAGVVTDGKKSVLAEFEPDYVLEEDYVYTLSFNIKTTAHAYELFADRISAGQDGYGGVTGDSSPAHERETDYGDNATSTGRPGFHSDEEALFSYSVKGRLYGDPYLHPVVQVSVNTLEIRKVDGQDETKMLSGAAFDLYRRVGGTPEGGTEGIALPGAPPGERYVKVNREPLVTGEDGTAVLAGLVPGTYRIWETEAPEGYRLPGTTWQVILGRHRPEEEEESALVTVSPGETDRTVLLVRNIGKAVLPAAGGPGSGMFFLAGLGAAAAGAALRKFHA